MVRAKPDGRADALTHVRTHIHRTKIVTAMSRLPASGLDKNVFALSNKDQVIGLVGRLKDIFRCHKVLVETKMHLLIL